MNGFEFDRISLEFRLFLLKKDTKDICERFDELKKRTDALLGKGSLISNDSEPAVQRSAKETVHE